MFTWICPQCGREVPPSYEACPDCAAREKANGHANVQGAATTAAAVGTGAEGAPAVAPLPAYTPPAVAPLAAAQSAGPSHTGLPTWLLAMLFAFAFLGVGAGVYFVVNYFRGGTQAAATPVETVPAKAQANKNPLQKYVEVSGIRFVETPRHETEARFVVVNHSGADIGELAGTVNIWGRTAKSEEEAAGSFSFKLASLKPYESTEAVAPLATKLKPYELPDWQNLSAEVQITSPQ
jgi:hypothetical protein